MTARWATIDGRLTAGQRLGVGTTTRVSATHALRLRKAGIDRVNVDNWLHEKRLAEDNARNYSTKIAETMTSLREGPIGFLARGGGWIIAQVFMLLIAFTLPLWQGLPDSGLATGWRFIGWGLIVAGFAVFMAGAATLGRALTPFPMPLADATLRTQGIYRWVRHPIYAGVLAAAFGWSLIRLSLAGLLFDIVLFVFFDRKAAREETWLISKYPDYPAYCRKVRKLIPWVY